MPKPKPKTGHHQQEQRGDQHPGVGLHIGAGQHEIGQEEQEEGELDGEGDQVGKQDGDRHRQAREIDLAEQPGVADKRGGGLVQAVGKVAPDHRAGHVEEELRQAVGGQLGNLPEDHREGDGGQQGLDEVPQRAEDGLFIDGDEISAHEEEHQVAVAPQVAQLQVQPAAARLDDKVPLILFGCLCHIRIINWLIDPNFIIFNILNIRKFMHFLVHFEIIQPALVITICVYLDSQGPVWKEDVVWSLGQFTYRKTEFHLSALPALHHQNF